jgi:hypothetical protein
VLPRQSVVRLHKVPLTLTMSTSKSSHVYAAFLLKWRAGRMDTRRVSPGDCATFVRTPVLRAVHIIFMLLHQPIDA